MGFGELKEIRTADDVTEEHISEAVEMRQGIYGGVPLSWYEVIDRLERSDEDWGSSMESPAIKYLQKETRRRIREAE